MNIGNMHLLLIEDNDGDARLIQEALNEVPENIVVLRRARRIAEGLEMLAHGGIDVILLDLYLPDGEGLNTVHRVLAKAGDIPVVALTVANDRGTAFRALQAGAQDFLYKDEFDGEILARALRYAIERQRLLTAVRTQSLRDTLTGLYNRAAFVEIGAQYLRLARTRREPVLLLHGALTNAEAIHSQWGPLELDAAFADTGAALRDACEPGDLIGLIETNSFAILCLNRGADAAAELRKRIGDLLIKEPRGDRPVYPLTLSLHAVVFDEQRDGDIHGLVSRAQHSQNE